MKKAIPPKLEKFPVAKQRRLDDLLDKNSEGTITPSEKKKLERLVAEAQQVMVVNAKRLATFSKSETGRTPSRAVPVWVRA